VCELGLIPGELLGTVPAGTRVDLGRGLSCVLGGTSTFLTLFTSMFLHGGWMHLLGNLWFLWIFGNNVEDSMGHARFLVFYLASGFAAAVLQVVAESDSALPMVGASGAIGGVMGAYVLLYPRVRVHLLFFFGFFFTTISVPAFFMLGYWFLMQVLGGASTIGASGGGVAFWAHVGGFVAGAVLIGAFRREEYVKRHPYYGWSPRHNPERAFESHRGWR
jgi:membrane associated rhomboid family serine protease